jgi:hypothetical protein
MRGSLHRFTQRVPSKARNVSAWNEHNCDFSTNNPRFWEATSQERRSP